MFHEMSEMEVESTNIFSYNYSDNQSKQFFTKKADHEELCESRLYSCPCAAVQCPWKGTFDRVLPHLLNSQHFSVPRFKGEHVDISIGISKLSGSCFNIIQCAFDECFIFVIKIQEKEGRNIFYAYLQIIGTRELAEKFRYSLELAKDAYFVKFGSQPCGLEEDGISMNNCLILPIISVEKLENYGKLSINIKVSPCSQSPHWKI